MSLGWYNADADVIFGRGGWAKTNFCHWHKYEYSAPHIKTTVCHLHAWWGGWVKIYEGLQATNQHLKIDQMTEFLRF